MARCPGCQRIVEEDARRCPDCGIALGVAAPPPATTPSAPWRALAVWAVVAAVIVWVPFGPFGMAGVVFQVFTTLIHEFGHTIAGWATAHLSVPSFDLTHGGGVTHTPPRSFLLALVLAALAARYLWCCRHRREALVVGVVVVALWTLAAWTIDEAIIVYAGHGGTLLFACLFLYRFLTGVAVAHAAERHLYALVACSVLFGEIDMMVAVAGNGIERLMYLKGKGGIQNDFVRLAGRDGFQALAVVHVVVIVAGVAATVALWRFRERARELLARYTAFGP